MGVPKFYRWISERYPCLSEVVREAQIPDFDNLYLDMNGIIHNCSHPNDNDVHFRITEEEIFRNIFRYLEYLFRIIKPKKVFFMAIDGVAPRAKMNQQRSRRFRSAKEAEMKEAEAKRKGEKLPEEVRFDSNCITPGTDFMARLHEQLKYFVRMKISTDESWQGLHIYLSGHETPGEGEHKIMDFIRYQKAQPNYDSRTRHCLYGLDADLIKLGLCSHEPNFSLLREEVKFGGGSSKKSSKTVNPEAITFHLLHISLLREYIDLEFSLLKTTLPFEYDLERIIDDWVLMGFLVGNDFIPHIPHFHIKKDSLSTLYQIYIKTLPELEGYLNEGGFLNLQRFQKFLEKLAEVDKENFNDQHADLKYFDAKRINKKHTVQEEVVGQCLAVDVVDNGTDLNGLDDFDLPENKESDELDFNFSDDTENEDDLLEEEFRVHKKDYYETKLMYQNVDESVLKEQAYGYIRAIQWNLHYYYNGCVSWSWYYPHHYAPYISDIKDFKDVDLNFDLGEPFKPYEQLLAVLPSASKAFLPKAYQNLVTDKNSPLIDYYPEDFDVDQNEKTQSWEAVVLIPFIDERKLLQAAEDRAAFLTEDEKSRNKHGPHLLFTYTENSLPPYPSSMPNVFPDILRHHAECQELPFDAFRLPLNSIVRTTKIDYEFIPGFPTLRHLQFTASLKKEKVRVFEQFSLGHNMILKLKACEVGDVGALAHSVLGNVVHVNWPHLVEAKVMKVTTVEVKYVLNRDGKIEQLPMDEREIGEFYDRAKAISDHYKGRKGIIIGDTEVLLHCRPLVGHKYDVGENGELTLVKQWSPVESPFAYQTVVRDLQVPNLLTRRFFNLSDLFPTGKKCFVLSPQYYGEMAEVVATKDAGKKVKVRIFKSLEPDLTEIMQRESDIIYDSYMPNFIMSQKLGISGHTLSRITGTILVGKSCRKNNRANIGLNLKSNSKSMEVPGFSKRRNDQWLFSQNTYMIVQEYMEKFPFIFERLNNHMDKDCYDVKDLFPFEKPEEKLSELSSWIKALPSSQAKRQKINAEVLDPYVVKAIEDVLNTHQVFSEELDPVETWLKSSLLFRSVAHLGLSSPDPSSVFQLFDRVVNVKSDLPMPIGTKGVVIGVHVDEENYANSQYDVVFDEEFVGGMDLYCSPNRGYTMSLNSLLNISKGNKHNQNTGVILKSRDLCSIQTPSRRERQNVGYRFEDKRHIQYRNNQMRQENDLFLPNVEHWRDNQKQPENFQRYNRSPRSVQPQISQRNVFKSQMSNFGKNLPFNQESDRESVWSDLTKMKQNSVFTEQSSTSTNGGEIRNTFEVASSPPKSINARITFEDLVNSTKNCSVQKSDEEGPAQRDLKFYCMSAFGRPPSYTSGTMGPMKNVYHTVILPNNERITDFTNCHETDAYEMLATKAMALLTNENYVAKPAFFEIAKEQDITGTILPKPPSAWIQPLSANQPEMQKSKIPESFVMENELILQAHRQKQQQQNMPKTSKNYASSNSHNSNEQFHPPIVTEHHGNQQTSVDAPFVPLQVARRNQHEQRRSQPPARQRNEMKASDFPAPTSSEKQIGKTKKKTKSVPPRFAAKFSNAPN